MSSTSQSCPAGFWWAMQAELWIMRYHQILVWGPTHTSDIQQPVLLVSSFACKHNCLRKLSSTSFCTCSELHIECAGELWAGICDATVSALAQEPQHIRSTMIAP